MREGERNPSRKVGSSMFDERGRAYIHDIIYAEQAGTGRGAHMKLAPAARFHVGAGVEATVRASSAKT